jgi:biopolymer transport protein ExbD
MPAVSSRGRGRRTISEINMVPFIDVMLVLLIIFMVTAPLITPSQIELPSVGQAARQPERFVQVVIDRTSRSRSSKAVTAPRFRAFPSTSWWSGFASCKGLSPQERLPHRWSSVPTRT